MPVEIRFVVPEGAFDQAVGAVMDLTELIGEIHTTYVTGDDDPDAGGSACRCRHPDWPDAGCPRHGAAVFLAGLEPAGVEIR